MLEGVVVHEARRTLLGHAGRIAVDDEERGLVGIAVDMGVDEDDGGGVGGGDEPFLAGEDVLAFPLDCAGLHHARVGAGARFGDRVAGTALAGVKRQ